ncbi:MAG: hypothetical protein ACLTZB_01445 [Streptococcus salivarius]
MGGSDFDKAIAEDFCQSQGIDLEKLDTKQSLVSSCLQNVASSSYKRKNWLQSP